METLEIYKPPAHEQMVKCEKQAEELLQILTMISKSKRKIMANNTYVQLFGWVSPEIAKKSFHQILISRKVIRRLRQRFNTIANEIQL